MSLRVLKEVLPRKKLLPRSHDQRFQNWWLIFYLVLTTSFFVARVVIFAASYGGVEKDSGLILGVAKNLAHRGIYASYSNTTIHEGVGVYPTIDHRKYSVQDESGFSYFPYCTYTVGPGYVVPAALLLKIFGDGWWQYRLWPLLSYAGFLFLVFYIVWRIGGIWALIVMQIWLWVIPQLTVTFAYESYSEQTSLFYLLGSFLLLCHAKVSRKKALYMLLSGCALSLAVLTKLLLCFTLPAFMLIALWDFRKSDSRIRSIFYRWAPFAAGFVLPIMIFEFYRFISLVTQFGLEGWRANNQTQRLVLMLDGSGVSSLNRFDWSFIYNKLHLWSNVGLEPSWVPWICFLISPLLLYKRVRDHHWRLFFLIYGSAIFLLVWFVFISPSGWGRHAWHGLVLMMMLISISLGIMLRDNFKSLKKENILIALLFLAIIGSLVKVDQIEARPILGQDTIHKWLITRKGGQGFPHLPVFPLADQKEAMNFFNENIRKNDRVYYLHIFHVAEMSALVDKVFYPVGRYFEGGQNNPDGGRSYLIFESYQYGPWRVVPEWYLGVAINRFCENVPFSNQLYTVCTLKRNEQK